MHVAVIRYFSELMFTFGTTYGTDRQKDRENRVDMTSVGLAHARPNNSSCWSFVELDSAAERTVKTHVSLD